MRFKNAGNLTRLVSERGIVLIAVLIFMAAIVPVTILILDSVRIETLMPINENYSEVAEWQADLGFQEAVSLLMDDQYLLGVDPSRTVPDDYQNPLVTAGAYIFKPSPDNTDSQYTYWRGNHDIDYLAEPWARHPENDTYLIIERSLENIDNTLNLNFGADPEVSSVPAQWGYQNIPLGLDDFGELIEDPYGNSTEPGIMPVYENYRIAPDDRQPVGYEHMAPHSVTQYNPGAADDSFDWGIYSYMQLGNAHEGDFDPLAETAWRVSPSDPNYQWPLEVPRPASYFRNNFGADNTFAADNLVYDSLFDGDNTTNQYLATAGLQQASTDSTWANTFFGNPYTNNKEYKPAPGSINKAPIGSEGDVLPAWHETIISDESGRFPMNLLMNIIFSSTDLDYDQNGNIDAPVEDRDQWDTPTANAYDLPITDEEHPNHPGYMMARDMVISLLMTDDDMRIDVRAAYQRYQPKAEWILRQMLYRRAILDERVDSNEDGVFDQTLGENSYIASIAPGTPVTMDGNGRRGDASDMWDGTWEVFDNPKSILSDYARDSLPAGGKPTLAEFERLNQRVTVYSFDTETIADFQDNPTSDFLRININRIQTDDNTNTPEVREDRGYQILRSIIGRERARSILYWRDGLVDLNGDGDLNDEFIEQPIKVPNSDEPITTLTYRERSNANFQDPTLLTTANHPAYTLFDPDYINIPSIGSLLTIPMAVRSQKLIYSYKPGAADSLEIHQFDPSNHPINTDPGPVVPTPLSGAIVQYPTMNAIGSDFIVEDSTDGLAAANLDRQDYNGGGIDNNFVTDAWHPSYNNNGQKFCFEYETGPGNYDVYIHDLATGLSTSVTAAQPSLEIPAPFALGQYFGALAPGLGLDFLSLEICGPDYSPSTTRSNMIAFSTGPDFDSASPLTTSHRLVLISDDGMSFEWLTQGPTPIPGVHDITPVITPDGNWAIFTHFDFNKGAPPTPPFDNFLQDIRTQEIVTLRAVNLTSKFQVDLRIYDPDQVPNTPMLFPMLPTVSPDGSQVAFIAIDDSNLAGGQLAFNMYTADLDLQTFSPVNARKEVDAGNILSGSGGVAWCPDWGNGPILPAVQINPLASGNRQAVAIPLSGYDPLTEREDLASELQEAGVALRVDEGNGFYQQYLFKNYPAVSSLQVQALKMISDKFTVRDSFVYNPAEDPNNPLDDYVLQAYGPKININTASRTVMRTIFLTMFQGPVWEDWNGNVAGPAPRGDIDLLAGIKPINLLQSDAALGGDLSDDGRALAIQVADLYAHQVEEYRKWVYNNRGNVGITEETVPDKLTLLSAGNEDLRYNYRANPFYPIDLDNNPDTIDKPFFDPAPPFRSTADLFRVMLYYDQNNEPWTEEGVESSNGPDQDSLPQATEVSSGNTDNSVTALSAWGPIYIEDGEIQLTHGGELDNLGGGWVLDGFVNHSTVNADPALEPVFLEQQRFRLFSADDFKRVEPFITSRTYMYRVESRGIVRVSSGADRMDVSRDKYWILSVNRDAMAGFDDDGNAGDPAGNTNDFYTLFHADFNKYISVMAYEGSSQGGFNLNRENFTAW